MFLEYWKLSSEAPIENYQNYLNEVFIRNEWEGFHKVDVFTYSLPYKNVDTCGFKDRLNIMKSYYAEFKDYVPNNQAMSINNHMAFTMTYSPDDKALLYGEALRKALEEMQNVISFFSKDVQSVLKEDKGVVFSSPLFIFHYSQNFELPHIHVSYVKNKDALDKYFGEFLLAMKERLK